MILILNMTACVSAYDQNWTPELAPQIADNKFLINAHDYASFAIICSDGDILSGEFKITHNGELFPGDQTEYDNWLLEGIDFFVFDKGNYTSWVDGISATPLLKRQSTEELTWSVEIPYNDDWFVVYSNDSIFMIEIDGTINYSGQHNQLIILIALLGIAAILSIILIRWKKK